MENLNSSFQKQIVSKKKQWREKMSGIISFLENFYTNYTMLLVVGSGLIAYFLDYKKMLKKNAQREAKISRFIGLTYIWGGILLYILVMFLG